MSSHQIASLSLKLIGIFSIIQSIPILKSLSEVFAFRNSKIFMQQGNDYLEVNYLFIGIITSFSLLLLLGIGLIIFSRGLSKKMVTDDVIKDSSSELSAKNIQSIAFSVVGLVMIVIAIPKLVQLGANLQALKSAGVNSTKETISIGTLVYSISIGVQFIIGILLFVGAKGLSGIWHSLQKMRPMKNVE
jgi:uncharacterized membrane protein